MGISLPENLISFILLSRFPLKERRKALAYLQEGYCAKEIVERINHEGFRLPAKFDPINEIDRCCPLGVSLIPYGDKNYPEPLKNIPDPPFILYLRGTLDLHDRAAFAIVGSRRPSFYGVEQAKRFSRELAEAGLTIVSGLAQGIDRAAHEAALEIPYGRTLAVLGSGVDVIYPRTSADLYERILERGGAVMSEYGLGTPPLSENFPRRNRIISGLSLGVLVVEAHSRSGSLITAKEAGEQGREVFAVPGRVDQMTSRGTHQLIKEGAYLAETPADILETLAMRLRRMPELFQGKPTSLVTHRNPNEFKREKQELSCGEESPYIQALLSGPLGYEELLGVGELSREEVLSLLTRLELRGKIHKTLEGSFILASGRKIDENGSR